MMRWVLVFALWTVASGGAAQTVVIETDRGDARAAYDCAAPRLGSLTESGRRAISEYVARMMAAGAVGPDSVPALMTAYERRHWGYLERTAVAHACSEGVLPAVEPGFPSAGTEAPAFRLRMLDGSGTVTLAGEAGRYVIIEFWATWCAPCVQSLTDFNEWAARSPDRLTVLAINYGEDPGTAQCWLDRMGFDDVIGLADPDTAVARAYQVRGRVGLSYLLDDQGRVAPACYTCRRRAHEPDFRKVLARSLGW